MLTITKQDVADLVNELYKEFPKLKVRLTKPWWLKVIFKLPLIKDLEWQNATQAIGCSLYLSDEWYEFTPRRRYRTLRHERVHLRQFRKYGIFLMALIYFFVFFPIGLAYGRARIEREAFQESLRTIIEIHGPSDWAWKWAQDIYLHAFVSSKYLYAWPFKRRVLKWAEEDYNNAVIHGLSKKRCSD